MHVYVRKVDFEIDSQESKKHTFSFVTLRAEGTVAGHGRELNQVEPSYTNEKSFYIFHKNV